MEKDINNLNICMNTMKTDIGYIKEALVENKEQHKEIMEKMEEWIAASKREFAPKWVADAMKFIMGGVSLAILGAIMTLILK